MPDSLDELLVRVRAGCPEAIRELVDHYGDLIRKVIRRHLNAHVRATHDPDDLLQSVWMEFFSHALAPDQFSTPEHLYAFLKGICLHKINQTHRKQLETQKRDRKRHVELPDIPQRDDGPERLAEAADQWEAFLHELTPLWRRGVTMLRDGYSHREVADTLGVSERSLARCLARIRRDNLRPV